MTPAGKKGKEEDTARGEKHPDGDFLNLPSVTNLRKKKVVTFMWYSNDVLLYVTCLELNLLLS